MPIEFRRGHRIDVLLQSARSKIYHPALEEFSEEALARYARLDMPLLEWLKMQRNLRVNEDAAVRVREIIESVRDASFRQELVELHEFFEEQHDEFVKVIKRLRDDT